MEFLTISIVDVFLPSWISILLHCSVDIKLQKKRNLQFGSLIENNGGKHQDEQTPETDCISVSGIGFGYQLGQ